MRISSGLALAFNLSTPNHYVAVIRPDLDQAAPRPDGARRDDVPSGRAVAVPTLALGEIHGEVGLDLRDFSEDGLAMVAGIAGLEGEPRGDVCRQLDHGAAQTRSDGDVSGARTDHADLDRADAGRDGEVIGGIHDADVASACNEARLAADRPDVDFATGGDEISAVRKVVETNGAPGVSHRVRDTRADIRPSILLGAAIVRLLPYTSPSSWATRSGSSR